VFVSGRSVRNLRHSAAWRRPYSCRAAEPAPVLPDQRSRAGDPGRCIDRRMSDLSQAGAGRGAVSRLVTSIKLATACGSSPSVGDCIGQPWQSICVEQALQFGTAASRPRDLTEPSGFIAKAVHAGAWLSATAAIPRQCAKRLSAPGCRCDRLGSVSIRSDRGGRKREAGGILRTMNLPSLHSRCSRFADHERPD
jgi:hypothetical protein